MSAMERKVRACGRVLPHRAHLTLHGRQAYQCLGIQAKPPTEQQLTEIRARWEHVPVGEDYRLTITNTTRPGVTLNALSHATEDVAALVAEIDRLTAALVDHEQQVRQQIARDVNRADRPTFAATEDPELVVKTTRAIDIRLIELGPAAPGWTPGAKQVTA